MILANCSVLQLDECFKNNRIIFFGKGSWLKVIKSTPIMKYKSQFAYVIDNDNNSTDIYVDDVRLYVFKPEKVVEEESCIIVITSPIYMYEMYNQLMSMKLSDNIVCYCLPFMGLATKTDLNKDVLNMVRSFEGTKKIEKTIHSFWFSGGKKPYEYQKCIDTWNILDDYKIIEWDKENYDWGKHPFLRRAIELEAWAYATDYARLDVLFQYGGIYMDMDIEVFKPFDDLLGNDALLSFCNPFWIDLAFVASKKGNLLIKEMLKIYDELELPESKAGFKKYFQPALIYETLSKNGIKMDGSLQVVDNATVVPVEFFYPMDSVIFAPYKKSENTYTVHYNNFGWSTGKVNNKEKKLHDNQILWNLVTNKNI